MLVEQLSAGRGITLPSSAMGGRKAVVYASGAYARIRKQFNVPVCEFEGVGRRWRASPGYTYIINAARSVTAAAIDGGEKPAVPVGILKYHCTEMGRQVVNDAMDVHGGKGIMLGPSNYLARGYQGDADRDHGRGREHPDAQPDHLRPGRHPLPSLRAEGDGGRERPGPRPRRARLRPRAVRPHRLTHHQRGALLRAGADHARASSSAPVDGRDARYFQHVNRYSAAFALAADVAMLVLGGNLKRKENLSARLGDVLQRSTSPAWC